MGYVVGSLAMLSCLIRKPRSGQGLNLNGGHMLLLWRKEDWILCLLHAGQMLLPTEPLELVLEQRIDGHSLSLKLDLLALGFL